MRVGESKPQEQSNRAQWLLGEAEGRGYLILDEILEAFPKAEDDLAQLEDLFASLHKEGIVVYGSEEEAEADRVKTEANQDTGEESRSVPDLSDIAADNTLSLYLAEMGQVPLLTRQEEVELAQRLERGRKARDQLARDGRDPKERARLKQLIEQGEDAREHLIEANTRLVVSVAKRYRGYGLPLADLIQAGNVGLIKAVDKFDYRRGTRFGTYATWWIRQAVTRTLSNQVHTIRLPIHMSDRVRRLHKVANRLEQDLERRPTPEEIADAASLEPDRVRWMLRISRRSLSLDRPVGEEGDSELGDFIEDESAPSPTQSAEQHLLRERLEEMLSALTPREVRILRLRYGMHDGRSYTLKEVGDRFGLTRERIRQIERRALRKLRHPRHARWLRHHL
jgi:RNA polymerase primary sigma factor